MMRTIDDLLLAISTDLVWRKKELTELRALVDSHEGKIRQRVLIRAAVALLYAHWEGFVKKASGHYLKYVAMQRANLDELQTNFLVLSARSSAAQASGVGGFKGGIDLAEFYLSCRGRRANVPHKKMIDTKSNLGSNVLKDILLMLGLDDSGFLTKMQFIDSNLVNPRNHVAHGEELHVSAGEYQELHGTVMALIEEFRSSVENAAVTKRYLKAAGLEGSRQSDVCTPAVL